MIAIYGIRLHGDKEVRYVGQTNGYIESRLVGHIKTAERQPYGSNKALCAWLLGNRDNLEIFKIAYVDSAAEANGIEKAIIALCLRLEHRLFNRRLLPVAEAA